MCSFGQFSSREDGVPVESRLFETQNDIQIFVNQNFFWRETMNMPRGLGRAWLLSFVCCGLACAEEVPKDRAILEVDNAGIDYQLQGEYTGEIKNDSGTEKVGVQIISLGKGRFRAVGHPGGLPGDGWDGETRVQAEGKLATEGVQFEARGLKGLLKKSGQLVIQTDGGTTLGTLKKVNRKSPTLGQKPPQGAVVLFDGTSAENFKGGKMTDEGYLEQGATSKQTFGSFQLHIEFLLSFMPQARGQGRSNSGVYMQGRYEVQVLDSFGLEGKNNECGGIYSVKDPDANMCYPPLSWQTYDVDFTPAKFDENGKKTANARMTVRHNGVVIHDNVEVPKSTTAAPVKEGPEPGPLYIQNHGNPVRFKNIWLVEK